MSPLTMREIPVAFLDGSIGTARAEGTDAAWHCKCDDKLPLIGRCGPGTPSPITRCPYPKCGKSYKVHGREDGRKIATKVEEI